MADSSLSAPYDIKAKHDFSRQQSRMCSYGFGATCSFVRQRVNFPSVPPSLGCVQMKFCYHQTPFSITCCDTHGAPKNRMCLVAHAGHVCSKEPVKDESSAHQTLFLEVTQRLAKDPPSHSKRSFSEHSFSGSFASRSLEAYIIATSSC